MHKITTMIISASVLLVMLTLYVTSFKVGKTVDPFYLPTEKIKYSQFRKHIRTGDLIMTQASNNLMSSLHSQWLRTPVAHVGIAVVDKEGDDMTRVFMFESSSLRGSQLRDLEDYVRDGVENIWIRSINRQKFSRESILSAIEEKALAPYSFKFIKDVPKLIMGFSPEENDFNGESAFDDDSNSCGELVLKIYEKIGALYIGADTAKKPKSKRWFPKDFVTNRMSFPRDTFTNTFNVEFDDLAFIDESRMKNAFNKILLLISLQIHNN